MCSSNKSYSYQAWDYSLLRVSLVITESLARIVLPLSTEVLADHPVTLNAAFFSGWRFPRRTYLFDHLSSASLASYSTALTVYVFFPINHFCLASFREPHCLTTVVLSTFQYVPEQSFAFVVQYRNWTYIVSLEGKCITIMQIANLPRCAAPVAPYLVRYRIQHTSCLLPCELLNGFSSLPSSVQLSN